jgi:hypothetical protein
MSLTEHYVNICGIHSAILLEGRWRERDTLEQTGPLFCPLTRLQTGQLEIRFSIPDRSKTALLSQNV